MNNKSIDDCKEQLDLQFMMDSCTRNSSCHLLSHLLKTHDSFCNMLYQDFLVMQNIWYSSHMLCRESRSEAFTQIFQSFSAEIISFCVTL